MELKFALLADLASETRESKLNVMGEFDTIFARQPPVTWTRMFLVARFEASVSEGAEHKVRFGLFDEDGAAILPLSPELPATFRARGKGRPLRAQIIAEMTGVHFPKYGDYEFHILMDGHLFARVPIFIQKPAGQPGAPPALPGA